MKSIFFQKVLLSLKPTPGSTMYIYSLSII